MKKSAIVLRGVYLLASVGVLASSLVLLRGAKPIEGPGQVLIYGMLVLSFPAGLGVIYLWGYAAFFMQNTCPGSCLEGLLGAGSPLGMSILWILLAAVGFFQWFVVFPALVRWIRRRFSKSDTTSKMPEQKI